MGASCKTSYWAEIRNAAANCAYKDHDGSRKNLNVTIKRDDGNQVPRTCRTRRTDAWARVLFSRAQTSVDFAAFDLLGKAPQRDMSDLAVTSCWRCHIKYGIATRAFTIRYSRMVAPKCSSGKFLAAIARAIAGCRLAVASPKTPE